MLQSPYHALLSEPSMLDPALAVLLLKNLPEILGADREYAHLVADAILCACLRHLGHADVATAYRAASESLPFWHG